MPDRDEILRQVTDRMEISDLLLSYFRALDRADKEGVLDVYSDDARLMVDPEHVLNGREAIRAFLVNWPTPTEGADVPWVGRTVSHHMMGVPSITVHGDTARTETYALSHNVEGDPGDGGKVRVKALRYMDTLRRTADGWRIVDRLHTSDLEIIAPVLYATTFEDRVSEPIAAT
jgi:ketosteroid isomerase-like protein